MSVQGGGGGKKVPPGGTSAQRPTPSPPMPVSKPVSDGPRAALASPEATTHNPSSADKFEPSPSKSAGDVHGLDDAFAQAGSPSGIDSLVRVVDASKGQIAAEQRALRAQAQALLAQVVASGFAPAQLEHVRAELQLIRRKMAALRKRLHDLQRKLKTAFASAGKTADADFERLIGAQLQQLRALGPGVKRAILLLQTVEQAYGPFADGSVPVLRLDPGAASPEKQAQVSAAIGDAAPGEAVARAALALLRDGLDAEPLAHGSLNTPEPVGGMRALSDALARPRPQE